MKQPQVEIRRGAGASCKAAHDLRQRFATLLRHEVRKVVARDDEVDDDLRHLLRLLAG